MAQRKKKPSGQQLQSIAHAQYKNEFMRKFKLICNGCCGKDIYHLFPQKILDSIYGFRYHSFKIGPADGYLVPGKVLKSIKEILLTTIKNEKIVLPKSGFEMSIEDYFSIGATLQGYSKVVKDNDFPNADQVKNALHEFGTDKTIFVNSITKLHDLITVIGSWESTIGGYMYWINYDLKLATEGSSGMNNLLEVYCHKSETTKVKINGFVRPIVRVGWGFANRGLRWLTLQSSLLNNKNGSFDHTLDLYFQSHTLLRMTERIDCLETRTLHLNAIVSFQNAKVFYDNNHNILIEYRIWQCKVGYFRVDIVNGIAVARTFLFLTQSGTPEGQLLWKNTGLQKLDTKYLAMDKLSSFMSSDIGDNEKARKILQDSGCQGLLDLYARISQSSTKHPSQSTGRMMLDYLGIRDHLFPEDLNDLTAYENIPKLTN